MVTVDAAVVEDTAAMAADVKACLRHAPAHCLNAARWVRTQ